jgi:hypothetical protein
MADKVICLAAFDSLVYWNLHHHCRRRGGVA